MEEGQWLQATVDRLLADAKGRKVAVLVLDDGQQLVVPVAALPRGVKEKQVLRLGFQADPEETGRRTREIEQLQHQLFDQ